eukprot:GHVL01024117.1.p1 GENE.GHVL01024117.1~~GHVL01024117.1.p1  ORF type:complete len:176 (+),score=25.82 GHVL01024117.1:45-530(+)
MKYTLNNRLIKIIFFILFVYSRGELSFKDWCCFECDGLYGIKKNMCFNTCETTTKCTDSGFEERKLTSERELQNCTDDLKLAIENIYDKACYDTLKHCTWLDAKIPENKVYCGVLYGAPCFNLVYSRGAQSCPGYFDSYYCYDRTFESSVKHQCYHEADMR